MVFVDPISSKTLRHIDPARKKVGSLVYFEVESPFLSLRTALLEPRISDI